MTLFVTLIVVGCGSNTRIGPIYVSPYEFVNATTPLKITNSDTDYNISVQLLDKGFGFSEQTVKMSPFNSDFGILVDGTVTTDTDGWANFSYHSPDDISELMGQSIVLQAVYINENNETDITQDFVLSFTDGPANGYGLTNQSTPIIVDSNSSSQTISAYVVDNNNIGISGETVTTTVLDQAFGSISPSSVKTDESGKASFSYTGPTDISNMIGQSTSITLMYNSQSVRVEITIVAPVTPTAIP